MREQSPTHIFGLDIGTQTVRCVVGMIDETDGKPTIIGHGSAPNLGMRKGVVVHVDEVAEAVIAAITDAERLSGVPVHQATVNVNGTHVAGLNSRGVIAISGANREITPDDRERVEEAATIVQLPPNREILQVFAKDYRLDGQDNIKDPVGMQGVRLEVDTHIVTAVTPNVKNLELVLERAHLRPTHRTVSGLAAAEAVLDRQQKEAGTLVVDIGAGTTNIAILEDGEVQYVAVLPVGGAHITNDLAIGLKTELSIAERVKIEHARLDGVYPKKEIVIDHEKQSHYFDSSEIGMITEARVEELFELIEKELKKIHRARKLPGGVVIVGGTAHIPGIAAIAKNKLQLPARVGKLQPIAGIIDTVKDVSYSTAVGLMLLDMLLGPAVGNSVDVSAPGHVSHLLKRATSRLRRGKR